MDQIKAYVRQKKICLTVVLQFCLSSLSVFCASTAHTNLYRGVKYLPKVPYITLNYYNVTRFSIFETLCLDRLKTYHKKRHFCLVAHSFTKLSQKVCLINTHILMYWCARCNCKLWKVFWFYCINIRYIKIILIGRYRSFFFFNSKYLYSNLTKNSIL